MAPSVAVLGAGMAGLSTAVRLQDALPAARIAIIADKFERDTTSAGAGGIFRPTLDRISGVEKETLRRWTADSWQHFQQLASSVEGSKCGVFFVNGYEMFDPKTDAQTDLDVVKGFRPRCQVMSEEEWTMFKQARRKFGVSATSILIDPSYHLPWLMRRFITRGGSVQRRHIKALHELAGDYDIIVNCTGLAASELVPDPGLVPSRGQVIKVHAPWIKHYVFLDDNCYIIPSTDGVIVGGTRQKGDYDTRPRQHETDAILDRAGRLMPGLKNAKIQFTWVGLRPHRETPRVELEERYSGGKAYKVVHHYGHGAYGIGHSWGTAGDAVALVQRTLATQAKL